MPTLLPKDADGVAIQTLRPRSGGAHHVAFSATSVVNASAFGAETVAVELRAGSDCYVRFGDGTVSATTGDHFLPADDTRIYSLGHREKQTRASHIAVVRASQDGTLHISELE